MMICNWCKQSPASQAIFRLHAAVCLLFRRALLARGFVEIQSSKFQGSGTESGAAVSTVLSILPSSSFPLCLPSFLCIGGEGRREKRNEEVGRDKKDTDANVWMDNTGVQGGLLPASGVPGAEPAAREADVHRGGHGKGV